MPAGTFGREGLVKTRTSVIGPCSICREGISGWSWSYRPAGPNAGSGTVASFWQVLTSFIGHACVIASQVRSAQGPASNARSGRSGLACLSTFNSHGEQQQTVHYKDNAVLEQLLFRCLSRWPQDRCSQPALADGGARANPSRMALVP